MFIALEGVDGCGKTTLAQRLAHKLPNAVYLSRKTITTHSPFIQEQMETVHSLMWTKNNGDLDHLLPKDYWVFLQCTWYTLLVNFVIMPLLSSGKTVIVDGWYYKFWARLEQQNYTLPYLETLFSNILKPDQVILLDVPLDIIISRKSDFKAYEMGSHLTGASPSIDTFLRYQSKTFDNLLSYAAKNNWSVVSLKSSDIEENCQKLYYELKK